MNRLIQTLIVAFITNQATATLIAIFILNPWLNPMFEGMVRTQEMGLQHTALTSGYFVLTLLMTLGYKSFSFQANWLLKGIIWGTVCGGMVFFSGHLIVAGWSVIPTLPLLFSGILDTISAIVTGIVIAYFYKHGNDVRKTS